MDKQTGWESTIKTNAILADIFDLLQTINSNLVALGNHKKAKKIKPYPRPGKDNDNVHKIGKGALPPDQLHKWIEERQHGKR